MPPTDGSVTMEKLAADVRNAITMGAAEAGRGYDGKDQADGAKAIKI